MKFVECLEVQGSELHAIVSIFALSGEVKDAPECNGSENSWETRRKLACLSAWAQQRRDCMDNPHPCDT